MMRRWRIQSPEPEPAVWEPPTVRPVGSFRMATAADIAHRAPLQAVHEAPAKPRPRTHTKDESAYLGRVKWLRCVLCTRLGQHQTCETHAHHIRTGMGGQERAPDWLTVALCRDCHQGMHGYHGDKQRLTQARCTELDLLADTIKAIITNKQ